MRLRLQRSALHRPCFVISKTAKYGNANCRITCSCSRESACGRSCIDFLPLFVPDYVGWWLLRGCGSGIYVLHLTSWLSLAFWLVGGSKLGPKSSIRLNEEGIEGITGAEVADGVEDCRRAVRRQIGSGADWIKVCERLYRLKL